MAKKSSNQRNLYVGKHADPCEFGQSRVREISRTSYGMMFPYNSMLQPLFDKYMHHIYELGVYKRLFNEYMPSVPICDTNHQSFQVDFSFVQFLFITLLSGVVASIIIACIEKISFKITHTTHIPIQYSI